MHLRLERITADCVAPMEAEPSIEGRPPGEQERQPRAPEAGARIWSTRNGLNATGSRARRPPEAGASERLVRV